jgi:hypothetical protein
MTLVQSRFPTAEVRDDFTDGWSDLLDALPAVVASRAAGTA